MNTIESMLLFREPAFIKIGEALATLCDEWREPALITAVLFEFLGKWDFLEVLKRLIISLVFISSFESIHSGMTEYSLKNANQIVKTFQPDNMFLKATHSKKVITKKDKSTFVPDFIINNLPDWNNMFATCLYIITRIFMIAIQLIFSTVYYFTTVFSSFAAILFLFGWTQGALKGTILTSVWCSILPFFIAAAMMMTGGVMHDQALSGDVINLDKSIWLFGITLLIIAMPMAAYKFINGEGIQSFGAGIASSLMMSVPKFAMLAGLTKKASLGPKTLLGGGFKGIKNAFTEPSAADLLKREAAEKQRLFNKRKLKNPFKPRENTSFDSKINELGISKEEAKALATSSKSVGQKKSNTPLQGQEKETYLHNEKFWNKISDKHRASIRHKYGVEGDKPLPNRLYYPVKTGKPSKPLSPKTTHAKLIDTELNSRKTDTNTIKKSNLTKKNRSSKGRNNGNIQRLSK